MIRTQSPPHTHTESDLLLWMSCVFVCLSVCDCVLGRPVSSAKTAEPIEMAADWCGTVVSEWGMRTECAVEMTSANN